VRRLASICLLVSLPLLSGCGYALSAAAITASTQQAPTGASTPATWPCDYLGICEEE
jgi:hypothetical protein